MPDALPSPSEAQVIRSALHLWFSTHGRDLPWRRNPSPYAVLVSEFMLQQTQVSTVVPYFERWLQTFPNIECLAAASEDEVLHLWQGLGYYSRARNLHAAAKAIVSQFNGIVPSDPKRLSSLPGVGPYTAGAIAAFAFDLPAPAVDANIARVLARLINLRAPIDRPEGIASLWDCATRLLPQNHGGRIHTSALMELGALLCSSKKPQCLVCPIKRHCHAEDPESLPLKSPRKSTVRLDENVAWISKEGSILLEQQNGRRAAGLWQLPPLTQAPEKAHLFEIVYPFTNHRITLRIFDATAPLHPLSNQRWFTTDDVLETTALSAPHRRALTALLERDLL